MILRKRVLTKFSLPDGQLGKKGNPVLIDSLLEGIFFEPKVRKEKIPIEVLNATAVPGLAQEAARVITNIGGKVVRVEKGEEKVLRSQLKGGKKEFKSFTFLKIKEIFG